MGWRGRVPKTGIYLVCGTPGSGKTYRAVQLIIETIVKDRRPVWTNIPVELSAIRAFIFLKMKGTVEERRARARYIRPLTQGHFKRFCDRLAKIDEVAESIMDGELDTHGLDEEADFVQREAREMAMVRVAEELGPSQVTGANSDWLPAGAVLVLDELHKWFPSRNYKNEAPEISAYTTMHRHFLHQVFVLTQRAMNVSLSFRAMAVEVLYCVDWSSIPVAGIFRFPLKVFRYSTFNAIDVKDGEPTPFAKPVWSKLEVPAFSNWVYYRLYRSYSHAGDLRGLAGELDKVRSTVEGTTVRSDNMLTKRKTESKFWNWVIKQGILAFCIFGVFHLGRCSFKGSDDELDADVLVEESPEVEDAVVEEWPVLSGISDQGVFFNGLFFRIGSVYRGFRLEGCDVGSGRSVWAGPAPLVAFWAVGGVPDVRVLQGVVGSGGAGSPGVGGAGATAAEEQD